MGRATKAFGCLELPGLSDRGSSADTRHHRRGTMRPRLYENIRDRPKEEANAEGRQNDTARSRSALESPAVLLLEIREIRQDVISTTECSCDVHASCRKLAQQRSEHNQHYNVSAMDIVLPLQVKETVIPYQVSIVVLNTKARAKTKHARSDEKTLPSCRTATLLDLLRGITKVSSEGRGRDNATKLVFYPGLLLFADPPVRVPGVAVTRTPDSNRLFVAYPSFFVKYHLGERKWRWMLRIYREEEKDMIYEGGVERETKGVSTIRL
ncbi:hypothetical protein EVAR_52897_1 [Eumeta japonica]|uniref:Uncharacterized protein n=1 Tax=Eumeta variegata TaxID=151549 RepID=A0A4C1YZK8_EUMVA|nr:hypothetical protein EVAR_52897_1 [Eumeta japonica]